MPLSLSSARLHLAWCQVRRVNRHRQQSGPNPLQSEMQLSLIFELKNDQSVYFEIYNPLGQVVYSISNELTAGFYGPNYTPMLLDLTKIGLKSGIYSLSTNINDTKMVKQLFVP